METCVLCGNYIYDNRYYTAPNGSLVCYDCGSDMKRNADALKLVDLSNKSNSFTINFPTFIYDELNKTVIGQHDAKKLLASSTYNHYLRINQKDTNVIIEKSNVLMIGPSGCGKTHMCKTLAKLLSVPFTIVDATTFTQAGYVGDDIETILTRLYIESGNDLSSTERGIVFIDEVDKLASRFGDPNKANLGVGVQHGLLKFLEGSIVNVPTTLDKRQDRQYIQVDTSNIMFICSGAFVGLKSSAQEDLIKYGLTPEFVGRLTNPITMSPLTEEELTTILKQLIIPQYIKLFSMFGVKLNIPDVEYQKIAIECTNRNLGARGLRTITDERLREAMFSLPGSGRKTYTLKTK